ELIARATAVLELDGSHDHAEDAYRAAGHMVLKQSDILLALWDGEEAHGRGGTAEIVRAALVHHIPVIWIPARPPHEMRLLRQKRARGASDADWYEIDDDQCFPERIRSILRPPPVEHHHRLDLRAKYFRERQPRLNIGFFWIMFRDLLADLRFRLPR